ADLLRTIVDAVPGIINVSDRAGRLLLWNQKLEIVSGYCAAEITQLHCQDFFTADDQVASNISIHQAFETGKATLKSYFRVKSGISILYRFELSVVDFEGQAALLCIGTDISEQQRIETALQDNLRFAQQVIEDIPNPIFYKDCAGHYLGCNAAFENYLGMRRDEIVGRTVYDISPKDLAERYFAADQKMFDHPGTQVYEASVRWADGSLRDVIFHKATFTRADGSLGGLVGIILDITERKRVEVSLQQTLKELSNLISRIPAGVFKVRRCVNGERKFDYVSPRWCELLEMTSQEIYQNSESVFTRIHADDAAEFARLNEISRKNLTAFCWEGRLRDDLQVGWLHVEASSTLLRNGDILWEGIAYDISASKAHEKQLDAMARYDTLTGIPNRVSLDDLMRQAIAQTQRTNTLMSVCYLDLDGFKNINDTHGHEAGDKVLIATAQRLNSCLRAGDTVARLGGDEFVLLLLGFQRQDESQTIMHRILETVQMPIQLGAQSVTVSASIGITFYPDDNATPDMLLHHADLAMYQAKHNGKNNFCFFGG
ncbi:MAG: diguanylate cyclase, partial [Gallionella sp.]